MSATAEQLANRVFLLTLGGVTLILLGIGTVMFAF